MTMAAILRRGLFAVLFYGGSFLLALASIVVTITRGWGAVTLGEAWAKWHRWCVVHVLGIEIRIEGTVPTGAVIVAGKHETQFEAIDLPNLIHRPVPFAKVELLRIPLWGKVGLHYGVVAVHRDQGAKALRAMRAAALKFAGEGRPLVIFPEGTRVPAGTTPPLQSGFAGIYKLLRLPVVPMAVDSGKTYGERRSVGGVITVRFGETIPAGLPREEAEARVHAAINVLIAAAQ